MTGRKKGRSPPLVGAAIAPRTPPVTQADLSTLAQEVGLAVVSADLPGLASEITEALREYALEHRIVHSGPRAGGTKRQARSLALWAGEGLVLLGGSLDESEPAKSFPLPHSRTAMFLAEAWPAFNVPFHWEDLLRRATGLSGEKGGTSPDLHDLIHCSAAALELFQLLGSSLAKKAAAKPLETKPTEHAKLYLVTKLASAFERLHGRGLKLSYSAGHATGYSDGDNLPGGRGLRWVRGLLSLISERGCDPEIAALADWARRPNALADVLRKSRRKSGKSPKNTGR